MTLTLDARTEQRIQRETSLGHYTGAAEVIAHALSLLEAQEQLFARNRQAIAERVEEGLAQAVQGKVYLPEEAARLLDRNIAQRMS